MRADKKKLVILLIVNACARLLGSRAGPRTGKEERGFLQKRGGGGGGWRVGSGRVRFAAVPAGPSTASVCALLPQGGGGGPGEGFGSGEGGPSGSACSRRFSAGSRGECFSLVGFVRRNFMFAFGWASVSEGVFDDEVWLLV